jgi:hypothetical protein
LTYWDRRGETGTTISSSVINTRKESAPTDEQNGQAPVAAAVGVERVASIRSGVVHAVAELGADRCRFVCGRSMAAEDVTPSTEDVTCQRCLRAGS